MKKIIITISILTSICFSADNNALDPQKAIDKVTDKVTDKINDVTDKYTERIKKIEDAVETIENISSPAKVAGDIISKGIGEISDKVKGKINGVVNDALGKFAPLASLSGMVEKAAKEIVGGVILNERACCDDGNGEIYQALNKTYKKINMDLATTEVLVKMYNDETLHTVDIMLNRTDEVTGVSHYEETALNKEMHLIHDFFKQDEYLPSKYSLSQILKIAVVRGIWHDKQINAHLKKGNELNIISNQQLAFKNSIIIQKLEREYATLFTRSPK